MYLLTAIRAGTSRPVSLAEAARVARLAEDEILWALDEFGICETDDYVILDFAESQSTPTSVLAFSN